MVVESSRGYSYFNSGAGRVHARDSREDALALGRERIRPGRGNPDKIILQERRLHFEHWLRRLPARQLDIVDVGGRIQPYRELMGERIRSYVSVDPQFGGLTDVVAVGEFLPFKDSTFDFAICTQVLTYVSDPGAIVAEIHRVLKQTGALFLTAPAFFPRHHDERWRFLPGGLRELFDEWAQVEVVPEGNSSVGLLRSIATSINMESEKSRFRSYMSAKLLIPGINLISASLAKKKLDTAMTANYSVWATK